MSADLTPITLGTDPEQWGFPVVDLAEQARHDFLQSYRQGKTLRAYTRDLDLWFRWCARVGVNPLAVRRRHVEAWIREVEQTITRGGLTAPATVHRAVSVIRCFYRYAVDTDRIDRNPLPDRNKPLHLAPVGSTSQTLGLDREQGTALLAAAREHSARNGAIISLLLHQALRCAETCGLNVEDLGTSRAHRTVNVLRKGGKRQTLALAPVAVADVERWLSERAKPGAVVARPREVNGLAPLFVAFHGRHAGERIRYWHVEEVVRRAAKQAGVEETKLSPHSLRHTCITAALDQGVPLRDVQNFAGHIDPKTTVRYDRARDDLDRSPAYKISGVFG